MRASTLLNAVLELPGVRVGKAAVVGGEVRVTVRLRRRRFGCPRCGFSTTPVQPDWKKYWAEHLEDWVACGETGPNPVPMSPGGPLPPTPTTLPDEPPDFEPCSRSYNRPPKCTTPSTTVPGVPGSRQGQAI